MTHIFTKISLFLFLATIGLAASFGVQAAYIDPYAASSYTCTPHFFKGCLGNSSYWYDSCGRQESVRTNCSSIGAFCQKGECVAVPTSTTPAITTALANTSTSATSTKTAVAYPPTMFRPANTHGLPGFFVKHFRTSCYNNNVFWYNTQAGIEDVYKSCEDDNACTLDTCRDNGCSNVLMCDGTTCVQDSDEFKNYCGNYQQPVTASQTSETTSGEDSAMKAMEQEQNNGVHAAAAMFARRNWYPTPSWEKSVTAFNGEQVDFLVTVKNVSSQPVNNIVTRVSFDNPVDPIFDIRINSLALGGDITSGIVIGNMSGGESRTLTFSGYVKSENPITATATMTSDNGIEDEDSLEINIQPAESIAPAVSQENQETAPEQPLESEEQAAFSTTAAVAVNPAAKFFKSWYLWGALALIITTFLFIVIFRRLSVEM